jgi:hypothetical protein
LKDSNGDGIEDKEAVVAGLNPTTDYSSAINFFKQKSVSDPTRFSMYSASSIADLNLGGVVLEKTGNTVNLRLQLQSTTDLATVPFTNLGTPVEVPLDMPVGNKWFLRVRALGPQ